MQSIQPYRVGVLPEQCFHEGPADDVLHPVDTVADADFLSYVSLLIEQAERHFCDEVLWMRKAPVALRQYRFQQYAEMFGAFYRAQRHASCGDIESGREVLRALNGCCAISHSIGLPDRLAV